VKILEHDIKSMNNKMNNKIIITGIILLIIIPLVLSQTETTEKLEDYILQESGKDIEDFKKLSVEERNMLFEEDDPFSKNQILTQLIQDNIQERFDADVESGILKNLAETQIRSLIERGLKIQIGEETLNTYDKIKQFAKDKFGVDLETNLETDPSKLKIDFGNAKLIFAGENTIGDGKTWLPIDKLPRGLSEIKYKNGEFILIFKNGGSVTIGEGAINERGDLKAIGPFPIFEGNNLERFVGLQDLNFVTSKDGKETGKITLKKGEITFTGDSELFFQGLKFDHIKDHDQVGPGSLKIISAEEFILHTGVSLTKEGVVKVNALYTGKASTTNDDRYFTTHVILDSDAEPKTKDFVRINGEKIELGGKGSIDVLGELESIELKSNAIKKEIYNPLESRPDFDGDFNIKNGNMHLRLLGDKLRGPNQQLRWANEDDFLTSFEVGYDGLELKVEGGKITGIKKGKEDFVSITKLADFIKEHPEFSKEGKVLSTTGDNLNAFRRSYYDAKIGYMRNLKYERDDNPVFKGDNVFSIGGIKRSGEILDVYAVIRNKEGGYELKKEPWFNAGSVVSTKSILKIKTIETSIKVLENENTASVFQGTKTVPAFIKKLPQAEFKTVIRTIYNEITKKQFIDGVKEKLTKHGMTETKADEFAKYLNSKININSFPKETYITNYWFPENDAEKRKPYIGIQLPNQEETVIKIDPAKIELFKGTLVIGANFLTDNKYKNAIIEWCQTIGQKVEACK